MYKNNANTIGFIAFKYNLINLQHFYADKNVIKTKLTVLHTKIYAIIRMAMYIY